MDILDTFSSKELYDICLKATSNIEIGGRTFLPGETVLQFNDLQLSVINEQKTFASARGGDGNSVLVNWDTTEAVSFICEKGVASKASMAIISNSKLIEGLSNSVVVPFSEEIETDVSGVLVLKYNALDSEFFIYDNNGLAPVGYVKTYDTETDTTSITNLEPYIIYTIRYLFTYAGETNTLNIGQRLLNGYMKLTARMRLKDDTTGTDTTGILVIPRVRLVSDLSMRLGNNVVPAVSTFRLQGDPVGERNNRYVCQIIYLDTDIDN